MLKAILRIIKWRPSKWTAVMPELGGQGGHWLPQYLADQLTICQPWRANYPHLSLLAPPMFFTFRHHCSYYYEHPWIYGAATWTNLLMFIKFSGGTTSPLVPKKRRKMKLLLNKKTSELWPRTTMTILAAIAVVVMLAVLVVGAWMKKKNKFRIKKDQYFS